MGRKLVIQYCVTQQSTIPWYANRGIHYQDATKTVKDHFDAVEYFGNLKGKNEFWKYECIAQIGLHRYPGVFYGAHTLDHHPEMFDVPVGAKFNKLLAWSNRLMEPDVFTQIRDHFMLADIDQNLFRSAIRMPDCVALSTIAFSEICGTTAR